jgi:folate-binding Fe-S cluster repair protein YgfZ
MGMETQAILAGHIDVVRVVDLLKKEVTGKVAVRDMQRPEYKVIEFQKLDGSWSALNLFLNSWAADDYNDAFQGPSTFLTAEYNPQNFNLVRSIAAAIGGLARKTEAEPWIELEPARA